MRTLPLSRLQAKMRKDTYKVFVNHPSAGFLETLNRLDRVNKFILPQEQYLAISDYDFGAHS